MSTPWSTTRPLGAQISYGDWFWLVGGITVVSLLVAVLLYLVGKRSAAQPVRRGGHRKTAGTFSTEG